MCSALFKMAEKETESDCMGVLKVKSCLNSGLNLRMPLPMCNRLIAGKVNLKESHDESLSEGLINNDVCGRSGFLGIAETRFDVSMLMT